MELNWRWGGEGYTISKKGRTPTRKHTPHSLHSTNLAKSLQVTLIQLRIDLPSTLDQIQRRHGGMCQALLN